MEEFLVAAHSGWRWLVLLALFAATVDGVLGLVRSDLWLPRSATVAKVAAATYDIQVLLGLALFGVTRAWSSPDQFYGRIHPAIMLVGLLVVHATAVRTRRGENARSRYMWLATGSAVALVVALSGVYLAP